ncbi:unnamed protein product [Gongylonema pulchrum]|uniref:MATH domain-containing protein n=1 Tax=Gongylonema pulchrum TaxID=637853 RepID=A0A183D0F9_9BILA|nr:unnamed protein product [Gongylonema pulchrum]
MAPSNAHAWMDSWVTVLNAMISSNGGISFGEPLPLKLDGNVRFPAFLPLFEHYAFKDNSKVVVKVVDEKDAKGSVLLTRLSLSVHNKFHQNDFRARSLIIVLYDKMLQIDSDRVGIPCVSIN